MTNTITTAEPSPNTPTCSAFSADFLTNLTAAILAPLFLAVCGGDMALARWTAIEAASAYNVRNTADLLAAAQIIANGLAALSALGRSMAGDVSLSIMLSLQRTANALDRSAERNRRWLRQTGAENIRPPPDKPPPVPEPEPAIVEDRSEIESRLLLDVAASELLAAEAEARLRAPAELSVDPMPPIAPPAEVETQAQPMTTTSIPDRDPAASERRNKEMWAIMMVKEAKDLTDSLPNLPPGKRQEAAMQAGALSSTANELLTGVSAQRRTAGAKARSFENLF